MTPKLIRYCKSCGKPIASAKKSFCGRRCELDARNKVLRHGRRGRLAG